MSSSLLQYLNRLAADRWAREGVRMILRALWLSLCLWCVALGGSLLWGWSLRYELLGSATLAIIGVSVLFLLRRRMTPLEVARRLDRRFHLDEQLSTAVEVASERQFDGPVAARLLNDGGRTAAHLHRRLIRRRVLPWSDVTALAALVVILIGLYVLAAIGKPGDLASASLASPPPLVQPPDEQLPDEPLQQPQTPGQQPDQQPGGTQPGDTPGAADPQTTSPLADALRGQGATRPSADALDQGDVGGAAQQLRELADQADQLSQQSREELANQLREAARDVQERNGELAEQLRDSADGLEQGGNEAQQALSDLAQQVEGLAQPPQTTAGGQPQQDGQPQPGQTGEPQPGQNGQQPGQAQQPGQGEGDGQQPGADAQAGQGEQQPGQSAGQSGSGSGAGNSPSAEQRQSAPSPRLGVAGQPLELEAQGSGQNAEARPGQQPSGAISAPGRTSGGGNGQQNRATGADPLRIPVDERDVVQGYFTP